MLRDMEEMLNLVLDDDVKEYLKEALRCYVSGSYRASVIMSVIAGSYDLHKKVKSLAGSNKIFRELDDEIEKRKAKLEVYEKYLMEQCATEEIDMLNNNELKELLRCLDTRNDCAHPSNFLCSAEKARDIYASIIDILASKPVLFGCKHMKNVIDEMEEKTFFPVIDSVKMVIIVENKLNSFHKKAIEPLIKTIIDTIKNSKSPIQKNNAMRFLALSTSFFNEDYEKNVVEFVEKDQYEGELLELLSININILKYLSDVNIEKIICKLETNLKSSEISNLDRWIKIILSDKLQEEKFVQRVAEKITLFKSQSLSDNWQKRDVRFQLVFLLLTNDSASVTFKDMIRNGCRKEFKLAHFEDNYLREILLILKDKVLFEVWIKSISAYINRYDFNYGNRAIGVFVSIPKGDWITQVDPDLKTIFVENLLREGMKGGYYSHDCEELMWKLDVDYLELVEDFLDFVFLNNDDTVIKEFLSNKYKNILVKYILSCKDKKELYINKLNELVEDNAEAKNFLVQIYSEQMKN